MYKRDYQYLLESRNGSPTHPQRTDDIAVELKPVNRCLKTSIPHPCTHRYDETLSPSFPHPFASWVFKQELMGRATYHKAKEFLVRCTIGLCWGKTIG